MSMNEAVGTALLLIGVTLAAILVYKFLADRAMRREEKHQQYLFEAALHAPGDPWNGATYAYPGWTPEGTWEWPQDQTITQFLDSTAEQPVLGIRASGPFPVLDAIEDTEQWIAKMRADSDAVIARLLAPLAETAWR